MDLAKPVPGQESGAQLGGDRWGVTQSLQGVEGAAMALCVKQRAERGKGPFGKAS